MNDRGKSRLPLGFASVKELLANVLGAGVLIYGLTGAQPDVRWLAVGAGFALMGSPLAGSFFEKKGDGR